MNHDMFVRVFNQQVEMCEQVLISKAREYANDEDRLRNFAQASQLKGETVPQALIGMMAKHTVSIYEMVHAPVGTFDMTVWSEKITDHINYLILLRAAIQEQMWEGDPEVLSVRTQLEDEDFRAKAKVSLL